MSDVAPRIEDYMPDDAQRALSVAIFRHASPDLLAMGWEGFTVNQTEAMHRILGTAAAVGATYQAEVDRLKRLLTTRETSELFGLKIHLKVATVEGDESVTQEDIEVDSPSVLTETGYATAFNAPHRADIQDYSADVMTELLVEHGIDEGDKISSRQAIALAQQASGIALARLLQFVGSGELDFNTGVPGEVIRFAVQPHASIVPDEGSSWAWVRDVAQNEEIS